MRKQRFTKLGVLKHIGRNLLDRFLTSFREELQAQHFNVPGPEEADEAYFRRLEQMLMSREGLPDRFNEALIAIEEMATASGQEALEAAVGEAGLPLSFQADSSPEDIALQVWVAAPELLVRKHNERRMLRLEIFEYYRGRSAGGAVRALAAPGAGTLADLTAALDAWFEQHHRGRQTTRIQPYWLQDEHWFLVRHGDTFIRRPKVEQRKTELLHYRPERDDVIVYAPDRNELRINARTRGEKELYRRQFGLALHGDEDHFQAVPTYTLDPLRCDGAAALDADGLEGIARITLREIQVACGDLFKKIITTEADDIFACAAAGEDPAPPIPEAGILTRAAFELQLADSRLSTSIQIRPPNVLRLGRHCDAGKVSQWLAKRGFRTE